MASKNSRYTMRPTPITDKTAPKIMDYAREHDPVLAFRLEMTVALKEAGYGCIEQAKKTAEMFEKNWAAFAEEIRRRNEEAGGKKIFFLPSMKRL